MTALLPILQILLAVLPEFEAIWPVISNVLVTGEQPQPAELAALWAAAAAVHRRLQAAGGTPSGIAGHPARPVPPTPEPAAGN